jgi:hypothetical protein
MKISTQDLNEVLRASTPGQLAELHDISETLNVPLEKVCTELLKLINARFPMPDAVFSKN